MEANVVVLRTRLRLRRGSSVPCGCSLGEEQGAKLVHIYSCISIHIVDLRLEEMGDLIVVPPFHPLQSTDLQKAASVVGVEWAGA